jgi:putative GTP pyrophosphokinase
MDTYFDANILTGTGLLAPDVNHKKIRAFLQEQIKPVRELMAYYQCAMMEVETKFKVLSQELSLEYDRNPIETIKTRLKSMDSITDKLLDRGFSLTLENIEQQLNDVAGVRVICGLPSDIYELADAFLRQDDVRLIMKKDYIATPKENGYRSLHLIVEIPIFLHDEKKMMKVEVQLRKNIEGQGYTEESVLRETGRTMEQYVHIELLYEKVLDFLKENASIQ